MGQINGRKCPDYDDPYKVLAVNIVVSYNSRDIERIMTDGHFVQTLVRNEVQNGLDINGMFCDCVVTEVVDDSLVNWKHILGRFSREIFSRLDLNRLREEVQRVCDELGIEWRWQTEEKEEREKKEESR